MLVILTIGIIYGCGLFGFFGIIKENYDHSIPWVDFSFSIAAIICLLV